MSNSYIKVIFFFRHVEDYFHSIENVFEQVIHRLPDYIFYEKYTLKHREKGLFNRIKSLFFIFRKQKKREINHITGHITYLALVLKKQNTIVTFHDLESIERDNSINSWLLKVLWIKIPCKKCNTITAISEHTKNKLIQIAGVKPKKIKVIYDPLPSGLNFIPKRFCTDKPAILVVGTKKNKNLNGIIEAIKGIKCRLNIIGKLTEEQLNKLEKNKIEFKNYFNIPYNEVISTYIDSDLLCFPSFYEGFGMPIIESQAIGRPVITSDFGAMKEIAGDAALFVDPEKNESIFYAIKELINNSELRENLIQKGLENVKRFDAKQIAFKYSELYSQIYAALE